MNLYFLLFNQEITKELQMFTLSLCHQARQYWSGGITAVLQLLTPQTPSVPLLKDRAMPPY